MSLRTQLLHQPRSLMESNAIIQYLRTFPAGEVYYIAPKEYFVRGYEYYRQGRLVSLSWDKDRTTLIAGVRGSRLYDVSFSLDGNDLQTGCICPAWSPDTHCKHVVCAFIAIKNILDPHLFHIGRQSAEYRKRFYDYIMFPGSAAEESKRTPARNKVEYSIVLEQKTANSPLQISIYKDGRQPSSDDNSLVPQALHSLLPSRRFYYYYVPDVFYEYLNRHGNRYPLFLKRGNEKLPLEWAPALTFSSKTGIDVQQDRVTIMKSATIEGEICSEFCLFEGKLVVDLERRKIGIMKDKGGWTLWQKIAKALVPERWVLQTPMTDLTLDNAITVPIDRFRDMQLIVSESGGIFPESLILRINHLDVKPASDRHTYSMVIEQDNHKKGCMVLNACCNLGEFREATTRSFFDFIPALMYGDFLSAPLRAKKRRAVLLKTFLEILSTKEKQRAEEVIRVSLNTEGDFYKRVHRTEAKRLLMDAFSWINTRPLRLHVFDDQWYLVKTDKEMESLLYTIPYELFGLDIFMEMKSHHEMTVSAERLYRYLPALYSRLKEHQIPLFFKGKQVKETRWDFSLDCRRESGIDWFEIKPEIRSEEGFINDALLQQAMDRNGIVEREDLIEILDPNSQEVLQMIESLMKNNPPLPVAMLRSNGSPAHLEKGGKGGFSYDTKEIVRVPRLQILDWIYLRSKGVKVRLSKEDEALVERLSRFEKIEKRPVPSGLKTELRPYQKAGYYWLSFLYEHRFGACLADDMGLGKTLQAISLLAGIKEGKVMPPAPVEGLHLLVLPTSLLFNWEREIGRFYPDLKMYIYTGKERNTEFNRADVVLTTYGLLRRDIEKLKEISFNVVIFDEAQAVKNILADTTGAARQLKGQFKLSMTGTPIENHLGEYYSILDLSLPGLLGDYDDFKSHIKLETSPFTDILLRRTRPFVLRRTKEKILKELPPKIETDIYLDLTEKQKGLYTKTVERVRSTITDAYETKTAQQAHIIALTAILKLRQLCVSPKLIDPMVHEPSPKIEFLIGKLRELVDEGHSALVFSQFTSFLDILEEDLKKQGMPFQRLDGSTAVGKRKKLVEDFQEGEKASIFLLSLKAGGQGLNLTKASYVFHLDPWWNPAVENQASDRAHRIGQKKKVMIMRILMRHTIEEKMMELKQKKLSLYKAVMEGSTGGRRGASVTRSDFDYLLSDISRVPK